MGETLSKLINDSTILIINSGWSVGFILILLESFIPILPLGAFVTLNVNAFGIFYGVMISWIATTLGSYLTYLVFYYISNKIVYKILNKTKKQHLIEATKTFRNIPITKLSLLITLPFSPSCIINLLAGVAGIKKENYLVSLIIGKGLMISFWAYIGKNFIESITDIESLVFIISILLIAYLTTKIISKKYKVE